MDVVLRRNERGAFYALKQSGTAALPSLNGDGGAFCKNENPRFERGFRKA